MMLRHQTEALSKLMTLNEHFTSSGRSICADRTRRHREIHTVEGVRRLQQQLRGWAREIFGAYAVAKAEASNDPPSTIQSGTLQAPGVVIEKFLFEAFPDYWVSASLYRPVKTSARSPALVMPVGHWWEGKAAPMYQRLMRLLARRGIICVSFDGEGHGERIEHFYPAIRDIVGRQLRTHPKDQPPPFTLGESAQHGFVLAKNVTSAHCLINDPGYLCGVHLHGLRAATGKRLIDLLVSRGDVDSSRIGVCGASGGGTDARLLAAMDERVFLLAPTSILGDHDSISGGDSDQCFFHSLSRGFSASDLVICVAPKPLMIVSASSDRHDTARVAAYYRPLWELFGKGDHVASGVGEGPHGFPPESRRLLAQFILKHFLQDTAPIRDDEHSEAESLFDERELYTTVAGNVYFSGLGKSPTELAAERALELQRTRPKLEPAALRRRVIEVLGEPESAIEQPCTGVQYGPGELRWETSGGVPLRIVYPEGSPAVPPLLYASDEGAEAAGSSPVYLAIRARGLHLGRLDVRGTGISATPGEVAQSPFLAPLLMGHQSNLGRLVLTQGRTLTGLRVMDLLQAGKFAASLRDSAPVSLIAEGGMGFCALIAAFLRPDAFQRVALVQTPVSWTALATGSGRCWSFADFLFGVLEHFDTPDLTRTLPPHKLLWVNPTDSSGRVVSLAQAREAHSGSAVEFVHAPTASAIGDGIKEFLSNGEATSPRGAGDQTDVSKELK